MASTAAPAAARSFSSTYASSDLDCAALIRARIGEGRRLFVAAGGDGTVNSVIQALVHTDAVLGVIPVGTYNHFARDLGLPLPWREALQVVIAGATRQVD